MKKTTIEITLAPRQRALHGSPSITLPGYECEILGVPVVIHRPLRLQKGDGGYTTGITAANEGWAVSEPKTGALVGRGYSYQTTIDEVLRTVRAQVNGRGGLPVLKQAIAQVEETGEPLKGTGHA